MRRVNSLFLLLTSLFQIVSAQSENRKINILLITADDLNCNSIGAYGCSIPHITPNIDRLAHNVIQFMNAHVVSAVSQPSRGALATGMYPHNSGIEGFYHSNKQNLNAIVPTLKKAGYYCGILGKVEHSSPTNNTPWDYIKDMVDLGMGRDSRVYQKKVKKMISDAKSDRKPFYLMINSHDPHRPFYGSNGEKKLFKSQDIPQPSYIYTDNEVVVPSFLPDLPGVKTEICQYYNSVKRLDDTVGAILKALKDSGEDKNTVIMFLSDNEMSQPFCKTNCYYHSTRTPWIVYAPFLYESGKKDNEHFISGIDFFPTILDIVGLKMPKGLDGSSFKPILEGEKQPWKDFVYTEFLSTSGKKAFPMRSIQNERFIYIFNPWAIDSIMFKNESIGGIAFQEMKKYSSLDSSVNERVNFNLYRDLEEFYDLKKDSDALCNLINHPAYQKDIEKMRMQMFDHMKKIGDPLQSAFRMKNDKKALRLYLLKIQNYVLNRHKNEKNK